MTNGEKMKADFPDIEMWGESKDTLDYSLGGMVHRVTKKWWNAEYKEPTTKNDLGVREFEEIVVEYPPEDLCIYPEYKGKPYFGIKYKENGEEIVGYGTYNPKVFSRYLRDSFMPSVTPQEPRWIPVSEKMPKDSEPVNIIWRCYCNLPFFKDISGKAFTATGVYSNGQWYWWSKSCTDILKEYSHNYEDIIDDDNKAELEAWMPNYDDIIYDDIEVVAWMPIPESYKAESEK